MINDIVSCWFFMGAFMYQGKGIAARCLSIISLSVFVVLSGMAMDPVKKTFQLRRSKNQPINTDLTAPKRTPLIFNKNIQPSAPDKKTAPSLLVRQQERAAQEKIDQELILDHLKKLQLGFDAIDANESLLQESGVADKENIALEAYNHGSIDNDVADNTTLEIVPKKYANITVRKRGGSKSQQPVTPKKLITSAKNSERSFGTPIVIKSSYKPHLPIHELIELENFVKGGDYSKAYEFLRNNYSLATTSPLGILLNDVMTGKRYDGYARKELNFSLCPARRLYPALYYCAQRSHNARYLYNHNEGYFTLKAAVLTGKKKFSFDGKCKGELNFCNLGHLCPHRVTIKSDNEHSAMYQRFTVQCNGEQFLRHKSFFVNALKLVIDSTVMSKITSNTSLRMNIYFPTVIALQNDSTTPLLVSLDQVSDDKTPRRSIAKLTPFLPFDKQKENGCFSIVRNKKNRTQQLQECGAHIDYLLNSGNKELLHQYLPFMCNVSAKGSFGTELYSYYSSVFTHYLEQLKSGDLVGAHQVTDYLNVCTPFHQKKFNCIVNALLLADKECGFSAKFFLLMKFTRYLKHEGLDQDFPFGWPNNVHVLNAYMQYAGCSTQNPGEEFKYAALQVLEKLKTHTSVVTASQYAALRRS